MATDTPPHEGESSRNNDTVVDLRILSQLSDAPNPLLFSQLPVSMTVAELKNRVTQTVPSHPAPDHQRLIFQGHVMRDADALSTIFSIPAGATGEQRTVHLVVRESLPANPPVFTATATQPIPAAAAAVAAAPGVIRVPIGGPFLAPTPHNVFQQAPAVLIPPGMPPMGVPLAGHSGPNAQNGENNQQQPIHPLQTQLNAVMEQNRRQALIMHNEHMRALGLPTIDLATLAPGLTPTPAIPNGRFVASSATSGPYPYGHITQDASNTTATPFPPHVSATFNQLRQRDFGPFNPPSSSQPMQHSQSASSHRARQMISRSTSSTPGPAAQTERTFATSQPTPTTSNTTSDTLVYLLSSPTGPSALVFTPQGTFHGASIQPIPPPFLQPQFELRARLNRQNLFGEPAVQQTFQMLRAQQTAMAQPNIEQQQQQQHQHGATPPVAVPPYAEGQGNANIPANAQAGDANAPIEAVFAQDRNIFGHGIFGHVWLVVRLLGFVWFFSNGHSLKRMLLLGAAAVIFFLIQAGFFRRQLDYVRRHFDGLLGAPAQPARPAAVVAAAAAAGGANADAATARLPVTAPGTDRAHTNAPSPAESSTVATPASSSTASTSSSTSASPASSDTTLRRRHGARSATPTPEETAARLIRDRRARDRGWFMDRVRSVERGVALFLASLYPGVGEQLVRRAEERARAEERRANEEEVERSRRAIAAAVESAAPSASMETVTGDSASGTEAVVEAGPSSATASEPAVEHAQGDEQRIEGASTEAAAPQQ